MYPFCASANAWSRSAHSLPKLRRTHVFHQIMGRLAAYCGRLEHQGTPGFARDDGNEALKRLAQMDRLLTMVAVLDSESRSIVAMITEYARSEQGEPPSPVQWHRTSAIGHDVEMLAEAFYYFAWRFREVIRKVPGFKKFDAVGIRDVRNHLIEHPEKQSKVLGGSFKHGGGEGPVLKPIRSEAQQGIFVDRGLLVNAAEMHDELARRLDRLLGDEHTSVEM